MRRTRAALFFGMFLVPLATAPANSNRWDRQLKMGSLQPADQRYYNPRITHPSVSKEKHAPVGSVILLSNKPLPPPEAVAETIGNDSCLDCHDAPHEARWPTADLRAKVDCESCHGPGSLHADNQDFAFPLLVKVDHSTPAARCFDCHSMGQRPMHPWETSPHRKADVSCQSCHGDVHDMRLEPLARKWSKGTDKRTGQCLACHHQEDHVSFKSSPHGLSGLSCTSCHNPHGQIGNTQQARARQVDLCFSCHQEKRGQFHMPSHHPLMEGKMTCTGCHAPHGSPTGDRMMLARENLNETCLKCHQNLAGPWAFEHGPVAEDCSTCHRPHGSVTEQLLTQPETGLCLKCHSPHHGGYADRDFPAAPQLELAASQQRFLAYQNCTNCHSRIHGSDQDHGLTH